MNKKFLPLLPSLSLILFSCTTPMNTSNTSSSSSDSNSSILQGTKEERILKSLQKEEGLSLLGTLKQTMENPSTGEKIDISDTLIHTYVSLSEWYSDEEGDTYSAMHYFDKDGYMIGYFIDEKNQLVEDPLLDENELPVIWNNSNPFLSLTTDDLIKMNEEEYTISLTGKDWAADASYILSGYSGIELESITLKVNDERALAFNLTYLPFDYLGYNVNLTIDYDIKNTREEAGIPTVKVYDTLPEHQALKEAFNKLKEGNYSLTYLEHDPSGKYKDLSNVLEVSLKDSFIYIEEHLRDGSSAAAGFMAYQDGIAEYYVYNKVPVGTSHPQDINLSSFFSGYTLAAEYYNPLGDGLYEIKPEGEDYLLLNSPAAPIENNLDYLVTGTYRFRINNDGTYDITYSFNDGILKSDVTIHIYDVGTTTPRYTCDDLLPYTPAPNWDEYNKDLAANLYPFMGGNNDVLPYPLVALPDVFEASYEVVDGKLTLYYDVLDKVDAHTVFDKYVEMLKSKGWVGNEDSVYTYSQAGWGTASFRIWVEQDEDFYNRIVLNFEYFTPDNPLYDYVEPLEFNPNATIESHVRMTTSCREIPAYNYYIEGDYLLEWEKDARRLVSNESSDYSLGEFETGKIERISVNDPETKYGYEFTRKGEDPTWSEGVIQISSTQVSYMNLTDTFSYYRWNLIAVDDGYTFLSYPAIDAFMATVLPGYDVNAEDLDSLFLLHFDEQKGVIALEGTSSLTANLPGLNVPLTVTHEFNVKISNVGTTVIEEKDAMLDLLAAQLSK